MLCLRIRVNHCSFDVACELFVVLFHFYPRGCVIMYCGRSPRLVPSEEYRPAPSVRYVQMQPLATACFAGNGQLGDGTTTSTTSPSSTDIAGLTAVTQISAGGVGCLPMSKPARCVSRSVFSCAGYFYTCALVSTGSGTVYCWGQNTYVASLLCISCCACTWVPALSVRSTDTTKVSY